MRSYPPSPPNFGGVRGSKHRTPGNDEYPLPKSPGEPTTNPGRGAIGSNPGIEGSLERVKGISLNA